MNVSGLDLAVQGYVGPGYTWANEMNFVINHVPGAGSLSRIVDQQSSALPLCYGRPETGRTSAMFHI